MQLSIGILSWGQHKTLINTLETYKKYGLLDLAAQVFIFFQEGTVEDVDIAIKYGLIPYIAEDNLGIAGGYRVMLSLVNQPNYLFLENDWAIFDQSTENVQRTMGESFWYLDLGITDVVRLRSRKNPGNPLWSRQFAGRELDSPEHLLDCLHWRENPELAFATYMHRSLDGWYHTTAPYANWTNNPHMIRTDWARNYLLPHLGDRDIELDLGDWWKKQNFRVAQGDGLFTHWRIG
jgi:hypothetical protein